MIEIVCMNPALDRTVRIPQFRVGGVHRADALSVVAGGKGMNVGRFIRAVDPDMPVRILGFVGGATGHFVDAGCRDAEIKSAWTPIAGDTRVCTIIVSDEGTTVVNEQGPVVSAEELQQFRATWVGSPALALISGSAPVGVPAHIYGDLVRSYRARGVRVCVDASGDALREALLARPSVVKINEWEFVQMLQASYPMTEDTMRQSAIGVLQAGVEAMIITRGEHGSLVVTSTDSYRVSAPVVAAVNPIGCGDAYLAGVGLSLATGQEVSHAAKLGAAMAAMKLESMWPEIKDPSALHAYLQAVQVSPC